MGRTPRLNDVFVALVSLFITHAAAAATPNAPARGNWPQWRGPLATGLAPASDPPVKWSEHENVRWKVELPGKGHAAPIIWNNRVFILTAEKKDQTPPAAGAAGMPVLQQDGRREPRRGGRGRRRGFGRREKPTAVHTFNVLALNRKTGETVWTTTVREAVPLEAGHTDASQASASPVTDGRHVYAYFGSQGLYCLDMNGKVVWETDLGDMRTRNEFGEGSSPALYGDTLVVNWDHEGDDFIVALNKKTGKELWRAERDEPTSWSTPLIVEAGGKAQVIVSATNFIRAYDLKTGDEIWRCKGMTRNTIPTPVAGRGLLYCISGFRGNALLAIRYGSAEGDISDSDRIVWQHHRNTPYVPSPLLYHDRLYFLDNNRPILSCLDAKTGEQLFEKKRLEGIDGVYASLVGAANRVYVAGRNGKTAVIRHGGNFEMLATNTLDDGFDASPALAGNELYLRGRKALYCIAEQ